MFLAILLWFSRLVLRAVLFVAAGRMGVSVEGSSPSFDTSMRYENSRCGLGVGRASAAMGNSIPIFKCCNGLCDDVLAVEDNAFQLSGRYPIITLIAWSILSVEH